jgi:hypothetical protein
MNRFEPVAGIRQRATGDGRKRILEIALLERVPQRNLFDLTVARGNQLLAQEIELLPRKASNKQRISRSRLPRRNRDALSACGWAVCLFARFALASG